MWRKENIIFQLGIRINMYRLAQAIIWQVLQAFSLLYAINM